MGREMTWMYSYQSILEGLARYPAPSLLILEGLARHPAPLLLLSHFLTAESAI